MTVPCKHCKALVQVKKSEVNGKWSIINLSGTPHNCRDTEIFVNPKPKFLPLGPDL
jgi:hypothetical protein